MSYSAIENLVDDIVNVILNSKKSNKEKSYIIKNLIKFQNYFDTNDILSRLNVTFNEHSIDLKETDLVSSDFWDFMSMIALLLSEESKMDLLQELRFCILNVIYDLDITENEYPGLNKNLFDSINFLNLRKTFEMNKLKLNKLKPIYFEKLKLKDLLESPSIKAHEQIIYTYFLDLKKSAEDIKLKLIKDSNKAKKNSQVIDLLPNLIEDDLNLKFLNYTENTFRFGDKNKEYLDLKNVSYILDIEYFEKSSLIPIYKLKLNAITPWKFKEQIGTPDLKISMHLILDSKQLESKNSINDFGGLSIKPKDSLITLKKRALSLVKYYKLTQNYIEFYDQKSIIELTLKYKFEDAIKIHNQLQELDFIYYNSSKKFTFFELDFFYSLKSLYMLYSSVAWETNQNSGQYLSGFEDEILKISDKSKIKPIYLKCLKDLKSEPRYWNPQLSPFKDIT